ncbi:hypothetical protein BGZ99_009668 [Dissophora globulifera]|uniref:WD40 repeat-like protein n=1 Tax=Dissophora globulifera TaxID=979702 RepID=A0A9P6UN89_9FUNG|nr:hypothetical protein BGZ99_009668 [Dissophora globulifera]
MATSNKQAVIQEISVDQIDFSPNISSDADSFFQTDADIARMAARQGMVNYDKGQAIKVSSKVLDMCLGSRISKPSTEVVSDSTEDSEKSTAGVPDEALKGHSLFLAESGHVARKINLETGKTMKLFHGHTGPVTRVAVYQTNLGQERLITGSWDKSIRVWDTDTKECLATLRGHTDFVKALAVRTVLIDDNAHPGKKSLGHELFSASYDGTILHWDLQSFQPYQGGSGGPWKGHVRGINDLCLALEEEEDIQDDDNDNSGNTNQARKDQGKEYLYSAGSDGTIRKWDITRGQGRGGHCVQVFKHHATTVYRVIVDATGKPLKEIKGHFDEVSSMLTIGATLLTGSLDGTVRRWSLKEQDLMPSMQQSDAEALLSPNQSALTEESIPTEAKADITSTISVSSEKVPKASMMTEEEERELAELMDSDDDD